MRKEEARAQRGKPTATTLTSACVTVNDTAQIGRATVKVATVSASSKGEKSRRIMAGREGRWV